MGEEEDILIGFEWHRNKAISNWHMHRVTFSEASAAIGDDFGDIQHDPDHLGEEDRYILIARAASGDILLVSYCDHGDAIRIISARPATRKEADYYYEQANL
jgi:uncharacterized DUF497 family protein